VTIESIDVTDANGIRVIGTVEVYRDPKGKYFDPSSSEYQNSRYADVSFEFQTTREVCTIDRDVLSRAIQTAFKDALENFGIDGPNAGAVRTKVETQIDYTRQQCALGANKYVSNETFSSDDWATGTSVGATTANAYAAISDGNGGTQVVLASQGTWQSGGSAALKYYDVDNTHPYNELDIAKAPDGKVTGAQIVLDQSVINAGGSIGQIFGSALGSALGGKDQITKLASNVVGGTIGSLIGHQFGLVVATSMAADLSKVSLTDVFASQNLDISSAGLGAVSSFLTAELGNALQIPGFGGQLFNAAANGFTLSVLTQVKTSIGTGLTFDGAIAAIDWSAAVNGAISAEGLNVVNLAGTFLGQLLVPAKSHAGAIGGQLLGAIGSLIVPGLGTLIGDILGTVIGDLFGNTPHPAATDLIDQAFDHYAATHYQTSASDSGSYSVPDQMADPALAIINGYLSTVKGAALDHSKQVTIGYQTDPQPSYIIGVPSHPAAGVFFGTGYAVQAAAVDVLQHTEVIGGDLLMKRAHQNSHRPDRNRNRGATRRHFRASCWRPAKVATASMACIHKRFA
jgi:hypothetical protein